MQKATRGLILGITAVALFSMTAPATRAAVLHIDPVIVGAGRSVFAAILAALILLVTRQPLPPAKTWKKLLLVSLCIVILFPMLMSIALAKAEASHAGVLYGILPLATALYASLRTGERPSMLFWVISVLATLTVVTFAVWNGNGSMHYTDLVILLAIILAAIGYVEGSALSSSVGDWQVICWALVIGSPFLIPVIVVSLAQHGLQAPYSALAGLVYITLISQLFGFFIWYRGLALGGTTRVSQVLFVMPFMTLFFSQLILDEQISFSTWLFAALTIIFVSIGWRTTITHKTG